MFAEKEAVTTPAVFVSFTYELAVPVIAVSVSVIYHAPAKNTIVPRRTRLPLMREGDNADSPIARNKLFIFAQSAVVAGVFPGDSISTNIIAPPLF